MKIFLWTITLLILGISNSNAKPQPSFDCNKAATEVEKLICSDEELSKLDVEMSDAYNNFMSTLDNENKNKLISKQKKWLENRKDVICMKDNNSKKNKNCLKHIYETRIKRLSGWSDHSDWSFFVDDTYYPEGSFITFVSNNAQDYAFYPYNGSSYHAIGRIYPFLPEEGIVYYHRDYEALADHGNMEFISGILNQNTNKIAFWTGGADTDIDSFKKEEKVPVVPYLPSKISNNKRVKIVSSLRDLNSKKISKSSRISRECSNILERIKKGNFELIYPYALAYSYEEIKAKYDMKCSKDELLTYDDGEDKYKLYPPYHIYSIEEGFIIEGIPSRKINNNKTYSISTSKYIYKKDCIRSNILGASGDVLVKSNNDLYSISSPFFNQDKEKKLSKITWVINKLNNNSNSDNMECYIVSE